MPPRSRRNAFAERIALALLSALLACTAMHAVWPQVPVVVRAP